MVFRGSNCAEWTKFEVVETIGSEMEKDEAARVVDVEEGEISKAASVEEGCKEDFNKHQTAAKVTVKESIQESRVWTMHDLYKTHPTICRGYASGLYNLAWAQAVQNKPLNDIFVMEVDPEKNAKRSSTSPSVKSNEEKRSVKEMDQVVAIDSDDEVDVEIANGEKEELEEGEIDLDSEPVELVQEVSRFAHDDNLNICKLENDSTQMEPEKQLNLIQVALEKITVSDAENSFEGVCSIICRTIERLLELSSEDKLLRNEALIQPSFSAIKAVCSVFSSMSYSQKEENNHVLLRLLSCMKKDKVSFIFPDQMKEIEAVMLCGSFYYLGSLNKEVENQGIDATSTDTGITQPNKFQTLTGSGKMCSDNLAIGSSGHNNRNLASGLSGFKCRGALLPLLDLHKEHDADSLPSPTREMHKGFPDQKSLVVEGRLGTANFPTKEVFDQGDSRTRPYETEAIKAVSSYQQKFGRNSFLMNDRLPSPTPSEECDGGGNDVGEEVSSSTIGENFKILNSPIVNQPIGESVASLTVATSPSIDHSAMQGKSNTTNAASVSCMSNSAIKFPAKSRDPRLRYLMDVGSDLNKSSLPVIHSTSEVENGGFMSSEGQNINEEPKLDGPAFKRQKCGENHSVVRNVKTNCGNGVWLEDADSYGPQLMKNQLTENSETEASSIFKALNSSCSGNGNARGSVNDQVFITNTSSAILPALLKDIAVNPAVLINLLKMEQQQLATESQQRCNEPENGANTPTSHSILGAAPSVGAAPSAGAAPSLTSRILQIPIPGILPVHSQSTSMDELGKIRMKPRDPRRILHSNVLKNDGSSGNEQFKKNVSVTSSTQGSTDNLNGQNQEDHGDANAVLLPNIARQFTKSLKNIGDIISVSKTPTVSHDLQTPTVSVKLDKEDMNADYADTGINSGPETGTSHSQSTWEDVEHLFEGFDDHQKAAIQRERARRIGEQKKMFSKRKLSLVLDLDHTLLNSAKFMEVDPMHDEILRKKEEQDREKQQRHLFRFPHMGMWTKLRPGIWNFLEKASKLYELHLYTMGNKLYATEMAKVLDPTKTLFSGRVISRGDDGDLLDGDERVPKTKDLEGVLGMESSVVIIDDSVRVWPHNKLNLIVVERYTYFPCSRRQFGLLGPSLLEIDHDERPEDGTLASSLAVIERIHQNFFSHQSLDEADVRTILATEQRKILADCRILFSRVFPVGETNPHLHPLWKTAEQFGALCTNQIDEQVTHVVAISLGTNKVNWALSTGRFVVHPGWVEASALLYRRANEHDFTIKP